MSVDVEDKDVAIAPAATLVIFGAMGDLTARLLMPALINLQRDGLIDERLKVLGVSRGDETDDSLRERLEDAIGGLTLNKGALSGGTPNEESPTDAAWAALRERVSYLRGDFKDPETYAHLGERLAQACGGNAVFFLAAEPSFFGDIAEGLAAAKLLDETSGFRRIVVEKPFGDSLAAAEALNARLAGLADESQIYRIDHFLGKETVRNIIVARFGNSLFEAVWNNRYIDHVQITAAETVGVGTRGTFYDATGALRDMVPNHLFQLLAMIGMEPPNDFEAESVRAERVKLIKAIRAPGPGDVVRGRYGAGEAGGTMLPAYADEAEIAAGSRTETYAALKLEVETWRWVGVPFYLRTGKALGRRDTEIVVVFKPGPFALFRGTDMTKLPSNRLVFRVQPKEQINLRFNAKRPGPTVDATAVDMTFCYADYFDLGGTTGYEALLHDVLRGDQALFQRRDEVEAGWRVVQPILDRWAAEADAPPDYAAGSAGPAAADALMARDGRAWHPLA